MGKKEDIVETLKNGKIEGVMDAVNWLKQNNWNVDRKEIKWVVHDGFVDIDRADKIFQFRDDESVIEFAREERDKLKKGENGIG